MPFTLPTAPIVGQVIRTGSDVYTWNGTRYTMSGTTSSSILGQWVNAGAITIGAVTTAPTKPATRIIDRVRYREVGVKTYEIEYKYAQNTAGSAGSGDYLFLLPAGLQFDTSLYPLYTGGAGHGLASYSIASANCTATAYGTNDAIGYVIPYSATQFRIWVMLDVTGYRGMVASGGFRLLDTNMVYNIHMNITVA